MKFWCLFLGDDFPTHTRAVDATRYGMPEQWAFAQRRPLEPYEPGADTEPPVTYRCRRHRFGTSDKYFYVYVCGAKPDREYVHDLAETNPFLDRLRAKDWELCFREIGLAEDDGDLLAGLGS